MTESQPETQPQGEPAVGFLVMAFTNETAGDEALKAMKEAKKQNKFYFEDAAVLRQDAKGKVHYQETGDMHAGKGAGAGALIGGIVGVLGGPAGVAVGASAGAALGALATKGDAGFKDESLKTIALALNPGTSAVAAITSDAFLKAVHQQVPIENIRAFVSNLAAKINARLSEGKNVAMGLILAESGLVYKEVAVGEDSVEVVGLAITDDAVIAGAAVVTAEGMAYEVAGATADGAMMEAGVITKDGALIVDDIVTDQGEVVVATLLLPEDVDEKPEEGENPPAE